MNQHITTPHGIASVIAHDLDTDRFKVIMFDSVSLPDPLYRAHREHGGIWFERGQIQEMRK